MTRAYYNEIDPYAAEWLRNLIAAGHIAPGDVDERDIRDVRPDDLPDYSQCHFYAGIGVWSYSLRLAGWPDDRPVWTFSEPCQPFSTAGRRKGAADERYLRPYTHHLVSVCRPPVCLGEQVASNDGLGWLDTLQADMEGEGYAFGAVDTCSAGFGAPHIRQRLRFVAQRLGDTERAGLEGHGRDGDDRHKPGWLDTDKNGSAPETGAACGMADADHRSKHSLLRCGQDDPAKDFRCRAIDGLVEQLAGRDESNLSRLADTVGRPGSVNGFWRDADWLFCQDGKWRPVEPGASPLAHGALARVGRLRAYGNAVDAQATKAFIEAAAEALEWGFRLNQLSDLPHDKTGVFG